MNAIRDIITVQSGGISYKLPVEFSGRKVELIVLAIDEQGSDRDAGKRQSLVSLRGALKTFANSSLVDSENKAWKISAGIKHEKNGC